VLERNGGQNKHRTALHAALAHAVRPEPIRPNDRPAPAGEGAQIMDIFFLEQHSSLSSIN
jgi:hypothetical protein